MANISEILESTEKIIFSEKKQPVSFREFVCGKDYCDDSDIYEFWLEEEVKIPQKCSELIIDGSLGGGKSTFSSYYTAYRVYKWFLNGDPRKELGIAANSDLYGFYFSVSLKMAEKSGFKLLYNVFKNCKWFKENMPMNTDLKSSIQFPNQRFQIDYASSETHQTGLNVIIFILDEANFRGGVGTGVAQEYEEVTFLYSQLLDRLVTRFGRPDGTVDALAILVSSASYQSAFAEQRRSAVENDTNAYHIRAVGYKIKPQNYSKEMFTVFSGTATMEPLIVNSLEHKNKIIAALNMEGTGLAEKFFLDVPVSIKRFFETNINLALQNHCGVPTQIKGRFLQDINILKMNYTNDEDEIFSQRIISLSNADDIQLADYLIPENIQYPERPHSLFLDLSITGDSGGFSCVRFDGEKDGIRYHTHVFTLEIVPPPPPHQTRISKYRQFMSEFAQLVNVVAFGTDQFQSTGLRQDVKEDLDLPDVRLSIDSSDLPHLQWVRALVEKAMRMRRIEKLELEVIEAEHDLKKRRVVKKKGSTDDLFQSVVGAHWLSDTIGAQSGSIDDLTEGINLVGAQSYRRVLKKLGYNVSKR